jgi:tyrosinase
MNLRKNVDELSDMEIASLRFAFNGLMQIRDNRGYNQIAGYHGVPGWFCWHHMERSRGGGTGRPLRLFLPWHRAYLYWLEQFLKDITEEVNLPWWDWTSSISRSQGIPAAFSDQFVNNLPNPLLKARVFAASTNLLQDQDTFRSPGDPSELPPPEFVTQCLSLPDFEDFEFFLENFLHDNIHGWVGGSMALAAWSAYDPLFWVHHCMVDRIWYLWQRRNGNSSGLEDLFNEVLEPFPLTVRQVIDIHQLGYDYALASSGVDV